MKMITHLSPPEIRKEKINLKFAWKFMKNIFNDYVNLKN